MYHFYRPPLLRDARALLWASKTKQAGHDICPLWHVGNLNTFFFPYDQ